MKNYTVYHLHSDLSNGVTNIDSITKPDDYINRAKECGMTALAFSEHGSVFSWVKKKEHIETAGMKYIHAEEFYLTETLEEKIRDNKHLILIARNYDGVLELNRLSTVSFNRQDGHFYFVPRITIDELEQTSDNIIVTSACLGGALYKGTKTLKRRFLNFLIKNKHRCFLEIQHHIDDGQKKYNEYLTKLSKKYNIPLIAGTDTHALNEEHLEGRSILQKAKDIHFTNEDSWDLTFKTYEELVSAYEKQDVLDKADYLSAIENTNRMADMVEEFPLDRSYKYPHLWPDSEKLFKKKIVEGIRRRGVDKYPNYEEYKKRIRYEMKAYKHNQAIDFMLLMEDIIAWCNENDIKVGYGRGSVNGSVIAWLLGITEMDSIKHKLNFDRFMNVERVSLSDIDTDFPPSRINDVKDYIFHKHGLWCCDIATFNTIADKGAIRDVGRAMNLPLNKVAELCNAVDNEKDFQRVRTEYPKLFRFVDLVKGVVVSVGNHPCGDVVAPYSVDDRMGLFTTTSDPYPISQIYMKEIDGLNYVKLDLLKLDTIELINETCKLAGIERVTPDNLDINDVEVWNSMRDDTTGIFQWEGSTGDSYIKKLLSNDSIKKFQKVNKNVDRMMLLSIGNSAIRPAGASYREDLANGVVRASGSDAIDEFLSNTFGYLVFQCQIIEFLHSYCGFTMGEADIVRRHFAKKTGTENDIPIIKDGGYMTEEKKHYIPGFVATMKEKYGMTNKEAEKTIVSFLKVIEDASAYLFSINHSQPYSYEGYACGWLRYHYPVEFLTCALNIYQDNEEKTRALTAYAGKVDVCIKPIRFRFSLSQYSGDPKTREIYKGIASIKFMNAGIAEGLYSLKDNPYKDFIDLLLDIKKLNVINARQLDILIKLGFFEEFGSPNDLLGQVAWYKKIYSKKQFKKDKLEELQIPEYLVAKYSEKHTEKIYKDFDSLKLLKAVIKNRKPVQTTVLERIAYEKEHLGYIQLSIPSCPPDYYYVTSMTGYRKNIAELHHLRDGSYMKIKVKSKLDLPEPGDIIKVKETTKAHRWKKDGDDWVQLDEMEDLLTKYRFVLDEAELHITT